MTSPSNALISLSGPALPPPGGSGLRAGQATTVNALGTAQAGSPSLSFAQILSAVNERPGDSNSESGSVSGMWVPPSGPAPNANAALVGNSTSQSATGNPAAQTDTDEPDSLSASLLSVYSGGDDLTLLNSQPSETVPGQSGKAQPGQAPVAVPQNNREAGAATVSLRSPNSVMLSKNLVGPAARLIQNLPAAAAPVSSKETDLDKNAVSILSGKAASRTKAGLPALAAKLAVTADPSFGQTNTNLVAMTLPNGAGSDDSAASTLAASNKDSIPPTGIAKGAKASVFAQAAKLGTPLNNSSTPFDGIGLLEYAASQRVAQSKDSALPNGNVNKRTVNASTPAANLAAPLSTSSGQAGTSLLISSPLLSASPSNSKGSDENAASPAVSRLDASNEDSTLRRATPDSGEPARPTAGTNAASISSILPGDTGANWGMMAFSNSAAAPEPAASGVNSPENSAVPVNRAADKADMLLLTPHNSAALPAGDLAFALRLKSGSGDDASDDSTKGRAARDADAANLTPAMAASGARLLNAIFNGSNAALNPTPSDALNRGTDDGQEPFSARSFASQFKVSTGGLSGQESLTLSPETTSSGTRSEGASSSDSKQADAGLNAFSASGLANSPANDGATRLGIGSSTLLSAAATHGARADGLVDANQFPAVQAQMTDGPAASPANAGTATAAASLPEKEVAFGSDPVRNVRVQVSGEGNQRVDMHMIERGGTLSVSVRSTDETLTRSLQDNLPDLNTRLGAQHFQTETWMPARGASSGFSSNDPGTGPGSDGGPGSNGSGGGKQSGGSSAGDHSGDQRHSRQSQDEHPDSRPAWVRQLAALTALPQTASSDIAQINK